MMTFRLVEMQADSVSSKCGMSISVGSWPSSAPPTQPTVGDAGIGLQGRKPLEAAARVDRPDIA